ncbi:glutaredoxin family protein [Microbacterium sp. NPDC076768]|uniref:glutaredoxin family protein n=1 Tax=Microbacterium sp. NPDC076768 TaxID=3154858 RepID=UPI0034439CD9
MEPLRVYTTGPSCGKCEMTKRMLKAKGIPFIETNISHDEAAREYVTVELGYSTAPVVVVDDEDHWCDLRPDHIERVAARMG